MLDDRSGGASGADGSFDRWRAYFSSACRERLETVAAEFPDTRSVPLDLLDVHSFDEELAGVVLSRPERAVSDARDAVAELVDVAGPVHVRVENNPHLCDVSQVRARHVHDLLTVEGIVQTAGPVRASATTARYECPACGGGVSVVGGVERREPARCDGCGWDGRFDLCPGESTFVDTARVTLAPDPTATHETSHRESLPAYLHSDLIDGASEDAHLRITGILRVNRGADGELYTPYLDGLNVTENPDRTLPDGVPDALDSHWPRDPGR